MKIIKIILLTSLINLYLLKISAAQTSYSEMGIASYYASKFHGKKTSSGEKYDQHKLTAAHNTLPFNTYVKVTNLSNNKSVIVKINDRGPYAKNRIIDLSNAAAKEIDLIHHGVLKVRIETITSENSLPSKQSPHEKTSITETIGKLYTVSGSEVIPKGYVIQLSSYADKKTMYTQAEKLEPKIKNLYIEIAKVKSKTVYRIVTGNFTDKQAAQSELHKLKKAGYAGFVRKFE